MWSWHCAASALVFQHWWFASENCAFWVCDKLCLEIWPGPRAFQACTGKDLILFMWHLIQSLWNHRSNPVVALAKWPSLPSDWCSASHSVTLLPGVPRVGTRLWCWFSLGGPLGGEPHFKTVLFLSSITPFESFESPKSSAIVWLVFKVGRKKAPNWPFGCCCFFKLCPLFAFSPF